MSILNHVRDTKATTYVVDGCGGITPVNTIDQRMKWARNRSGLSQAQVAVIAGVKQGTIANIESGLRKSPREIVAIAAALKVSPAWLKDGSGAFDDADHEPYPIINLDNNPDYPAIRRVSVKAQAGVTGYAIEDVEDVPPIVFRADWFASHGYVPSKMMALRVSGESMVPSLYPGDLIVVNTASTTPRDAVAFLVAYYGEVVVKRLVMDAGQWWLSSDNHDQRRFGRKLCDEQTQIVGEVVYKQSEMV